MTNQSNCFGLRPTHWLVKLIFIDLSFLILLCAGNTPTLFIYEMRLWISYSLRYFIYAKIVTTLIQGQSAGNNSLIWIGTSETTRNNIESNNINISNSSENIKSISEHVPTHLKPLSDENFGHYLAGLIDGDGWFQKYQINIVFNILDASLAYYIKGRLGYGTVTKIKSKNAIVLSITKREGLEKVINLINGKLRVQFKIDAINRHIINVYKKPLVIKDELHLNTSSDLDNYWLAGFIDAVPSGSGSFQIKTIDREAAFLPFLPHFFFQKKWKKTKAKLPCAIAVQDPSESGNTRLEVRLYMQLDQKTRLLLDLIKDKFGGNIGYRKSLDIYHYNSTSFGSAKKLIEYLDKYHLLSSKHLNYLKWRKAYLLIQNNKHLTLEGQEKIKQLKSTSAAWGS